MARPPRNLLLVLADEMRGGDMGHVGNGDVLTPHTDRLAREGVSFTNAIANCPVCTPSRGSLLTGVHAHRHCALANDMPIRTDLPTLGTVLRDAGYATGYIGKWHLDGLPRDVFTPPGPRRLGFDDTWAVWNCHHDYFNGRYYADTPEVRRIGGYEPDGQTDLAIEFMERKRGEPFALVLSWGPPHGPLELVPDEYRRMYDPGKITLSPNVRPDRTDRYTLSVAVPPWEPTEGCRTRLDGEMEERIRESLACYYAAITALDHNLGRLLDALARLGLAENTIVVFTSDHGGMHWSHGRIRKQQPWEESIRVPLVIRAPGRLASGLKTRVLTGMVDLMPTLLDLLGRASPEGLDGSSVAPAVLGQAPARRSLLVGIPVPVDSVTEEGVDRGWRGVRTEQHTYARWEDRSPWVLYDNAADPYQLRNLVELPRAEDLRKRMDEELDRLLARCGDGSLTWQEELARCGAVEAWNRRERECNPDAARLVSVGTRKSGARE
ncbi:MAG: sulfatase [Planctomycetota bacterium]